jgi:predicted naringenin-chalcone synthase
MGTPRPAILAVGTALPQYSGDQNAIGEWLAASFGERSAQGRILRSLCRESGIDRRYACIPNYLELPTESRFAPGTPAERSPSTAERMAIYEQEAAPLGVQAVQAAFTDYAATTGEAPAAVSARVTHLVVVSCTGFYAPGIDFIMAKLLGLRPTVERTLIGFMGCSAMFNGLRAANAIVRADPNALALVVSVELCSLHTQPNPQRDHLIGASIFADGASACLVGMPTADPAQPANDHFLLDCFQTRMKPDTEEEMAWQIGNYGFNLRLSPRVPEHLAEAAPAALAALFGSTRPAFWIIHPGGRSIIDRLAEILALDENDVAASRQVLRAMGNASSATILFVVAAMRDRLRRAPTAQPQTGVAMAFGPGLVLEMARLIYVPSPSPVASAQQHAKSRPAAVLVEQG